MGTAPFTLNDALELLLKVHPKAGSSTFTTYLRGAFAGLVTVTGDKAIADFTRANARRYLEASPASGVKTTTTAACLGLAQCLPLTCGSTAYRRPIRSLGLPWQSAYSGERDR